LRRYEFDLGVKLRARLLTTVPDSTSLKFLLLGTLTRRSDKKGSAGERHIVVHIDFESLKKRKCQDSDMEKWYARKIGKGGEADCLMGHKQWFTRRKPDADCVVADKWNDPVGREENCPCDDEDYEWCDFASLSSLASSGPSVEGRRHTVIITSLPTEWATVSLSDPNRFLKVNVEKMEINSWVHQGSD